MPQNELPPIQQIWEGLRELMNHASPAEFDRILDVWMDLQAWNKNSGEMPHQKLLHKWGLLGDTVAARAVTREVATSPNGATPVPTNRDEVAHPNMQETRAAREIEWQLEATAAAARSAAEGDHLPQLNELLGRVSIWKAAGEHGALSRALYRRVVEAEQTMVALRAEVRERLGANSSLLGGGLYTQAYLMAEEYFRRAVPVIIDSAGIFGPADTEVPTVTFRKRVKELCLTTLRQRASDRLAIAKGQIATDPEKALETVADGRQLLTADFLTTDDRRALERDLEPLDELERDIRRTLEKFNQAKGLVVRARSGEVSRSEALRLLVEAQQLYPDYPNLLAHLEQARSDVANLDVTRLKNAMDQARLQRSRGDFEGALATIADARAAATETIILSRVEGELAQVLQQLDYMAMGIAEGGALHGHLAEGLDRLCTKLERAAGGDGEALASACHLAAELRVLLSGENT